MQQPRWGRRFRHAVERTFLMGTLACIARPAMDTLSGRPDMAATNARIPADEQEVFAMAYMIGYLGWAPDEIVHAFPDVEEWDSCPDFVPDDLAHEWKRGYDSGVAFFSDHAQDEEV